MSRRLTVCSDGTWQSEDAAVPSNISRLADAVDTKGSDGKAQYVFYQPGVGTDPARRLVDRKLSAWLGGGLGIGLDRNIIDIYRWLIHEYKPGDELWFFGFSRGAYTVRSTVGLLRNCGILKPSYERLAERAMDLYRARAPESHPDAPRSRSFRRNYAHEIREVRFVGVWDTVGALGVPGWLGLPAAVANRRYRFHDTQLSSIVSHAYHVLAIDEQRRTFSPALWREETADFAGTVKQVWFPGAHSDVGGGYEERGLGDLTLRWMLDRAVELGLGVLPAAASALKPSHMGPQHDSRWLPHRWPIVKSAATALREIRPGHHQVIHPSAVDRMRDMATYRPANLRNGPDYEVPIGD
jgi:uncharacterized protein (DUF2235 family)